MLVASICEALLFGGSPQPAVEDIALSWDAPPECPAQAEVVARVRARWGERPAVRIEAEAVVARSPRDPGVWHLRLWVRGDELVAEREIEARSCDALTEAAATMLAVAATTPTPAASVEIPAPAAVVAAEPAAPAAARVEPIASVSSEEPRAALAPSRRTSPPRARLGAFGGVDHGALPGTGATIVGEIGVHWPRVRLSAFGLYGFGRRVTARDVAAQHRLAAGGVSVCGVAPLGAFELGGCASAELGALSSAGIRGRALQRQQSPWAAGSLGAFGSWRFASRWALVLRVDAVLPLVRRRFFVGDALVGRIGPIGVRALAGLTVVLP